ncbi:hypothetical protein [Hydrocarboniclastica marina]|uniref:Uncharacterized protein n=1 Tax=Hydrocarboniclastica marina TaxID=2259620 RepID=A0A4P7XMC1_9ALTE|nr:hypothetical protein [Hydrocarboniclastica marina]QCF28083.1 hypothetical protein soil367_18595 [Hydrocarboniclastica marina]
MDAKFKNYPASWAVALAPAFGVVVFVAAALGGAIPANLAQPVTWVVIIWNGVHLGVAFLLTSVLFQYSKGILAEVQKRIVSPKRKYLRIAEDQK